MLDGQTTLATVICHNKTKNDRDRPQMVKTIPVRHHMSIKLRYTLFFVGCIAHAEFLSLTLAHEFWNEALNHILWPDVFYPIWWILILVWPGWIIVLWKYGLNGNRALKVLSVVVPVISSLIIMRWVLGYLLLWLSFAMGAHM